MRDMDSYQKIVTVEEHNTTGGLGSIVAEIASYNGKNVKIIPIGINDQFAEGYGSQRIVRRNNQLDAESIYQIVKEAIQSE